MTQKLTLTVKPESIRKAKEYAKRKNTSVSKLFEAFVEAQANDYETRVAARLEALNRLKGSLSGLDDGRDYKVIIQEAREEKYFRS